MPYNVSAIPPPEEITGSATLPLARVKKILAVDDDISAVSANASFAITIATEMFIRYFADQALNVVKSEKKPRRQIQYRDLANAVSRIDNLTFLEDIVPRTTTYKEFKSRRGRATNQDNAGHLSNGQTRLDAPVKIVDPLTSAQHDMHPTTSVGMDGIILHSPAQAHGDTNGPLASNVRQLVFEHYEPSGVRTDNSGDIEME